jgi:hypothetical protein
MEQIIMNPNGDIYDIKTRTWKFNNKISIVNPTKKYSMKISIEIHLLKWHLIPFKTPLGFTWLCFDFYKY